MRGRPLRYFVTGGTGFVGAAVIAHLLRLGSTVYALVRSDAARLIPALMSIDPTRGWQKGTLIPVLGDVTLPNLGLSTADISKMLGRVDVVIHVAGNTKFDDEGEENLNINFYGTKNLEELAQQIGFKRFVHVSTSYVWGRLTGEMPEHPVDVRMIDQIVHNKYERSKIMAEEYLRHELHQQLVIVRPSIVVGALGNMWPGSVPVTFEAYYGYFRGFSYFQHRMGGSLNLESHRIPGCAQAEINLIPVDNLVEMIYAAATHPKAAGQILHATNPRGPKYEWLVRSTFDIMHISGGRIVPFAEMEAADVRLTDHEQMILPAIKPFEGYVGEDRTFATDNMKEIYDMSRVPSFDEDDRSLDLVHRLITPALTHRFKSVEQRAKAAAKKAVVAA